MKNFLLLALCFVLFVSGCHKDAAPAPGLAGNNPALNISKSGFKHTLSQSVDANGVTTTITYISNGNYDVKVSIPSALLRPNSGYTFIIYGTAGNSQTFTNQSRVWEITYALNVGTHFISYDDGAGFSGNSNNFTISAQPVIPNPSQGWIGLYTYFNSDSKRYYYTNTWEELGSFSQGYEFEQLQGVMYDNATRASNLIPVYRYYNSTSNDHYLTITMGTYSGYTFDKIIGYISSVSSSSSFSQLNEYYSSTYGHIYVSSPEVPAPFTSSTFDTSLGYFPASTSPQYVYEFWDQTDGKHAYSFNINLSAGNPSYKFNGQPFYAYETLVSGTVPVYQFYNSSTQDHVLTTNRNPSFPAGYNYDGIAFYAYTSNVSGSVPIYEFYSNTGVDHFYSADRNAAAVYPGYAYNATPFYALPPTSVPQDVYEFYNSQIGKHVYSLNINLPNSSPGYAYNGQPCKAYPVYIPGTTAVYQFVNNSSQDHVLTTNPNPGWAGYTYQGTMGYAYTAQASGTVPLYEFYSPSGADHFYSTNRNANSGYSGWNYNGLPFYVVPN